MINLTKILVAAALIATATIPPVSAQSVSFLEAGLYFLTGVEPAPGDAVTEGRIVLSKYPVVAYLMPDNPCEVRVRTTGKTYVRHIVWSMDFCKLQSFQRGGGRKEYWVFWGDVSAFCANTTDKDEDYLGRMRRAGEKCTSSVESSTFVFHGYWNVNTLMGNKEGLPLRSQDRLLAATKYIQRLLTGKPY